MQTCLVNIWNQWWIEVVVLVCDEEACCWIPKLARMRWWWWDEWRVEDFVGTDNGRVIRVGGSRKEIMRWTSTKPDSFKKTTSRFYLDKAGVNQGLGGLFSSNTFGLEWTCLSRSVESVVKESTRSDKSVGGWVMSQKLIISRVNL